MSKEFIEDKYGTLIEIGDIIMYRNDGGFRTLPNHIIEEYEEGHYGETVYEQVWGFLTTKTTCIVNPRPYICALIGPIPEDITVLHKGKDSITEIAKTMHTLTDVLDKHEDKHILKTISERIDALIFMERHPKYSDEFYE